MAAPVRGHQDVTPDRRLRDLLRTVRANAGVTVVLSVGLLALALVVVAREPPGYRASSQVLVPATPAALTAEPAGTHRDVTLDTEASRALSDVSMDDVAGATGVTDPREFARVRALPVSRVLVLEYGGADPERVNDGLRAWTESYLREQTAFVEQRSAVVLDALEALPVDQAAARGTALAQGEAQSAWRATVNAQLQREFRLRDLGESHASIVRRSAAEPVRKPWATTAASALMLGLLVGTAGGLRRASAARAAPR